MGALLGSAGTVGPRLLRTLGAGAMAVFAEGDRGRERFQPLAWEPPVCPNAAIYQVFGTRTG